MSYSFDTDSSRVRRNKYGEVRSSDLEDLDVESAFFGRPYFGPWGVLRPQIFNALENHQVLLVPTGDGGPLTTFFKGGPKIGLKM